MKRLLAAWTLFAICASASEFDLTDENLRDATLIPKSESKERIGLYCIHRGATTATFMALMDQTKNKILAEIPIRSTYSIPRPADEWLDVAWNDTGSAVAIHDSMDRDSRVQIYFRHPDGTFKLVELPDLRAINAARIGLKVSAIKSSGQKPLKWVSDHLLMVTFQYFTPDGKRFRREYGIAIDDQGNHVPQ